MNCWLLWDNRYRPRGGTNRLVLFVICIATGLVKRYSTVSRGVSGHLVGLLSSLVLFVFGFASGFSM